MANLKEIRGRIKSITSIQKVTSAMKMVAAAKLRTSQSNMEQCRPYSNKISILLNDLLSDCDNINFDLMQKREVSKTLYVVITSDRGMAGAFNTNILKKAQCITENLFLQKVYIIRLNDDRTRSHLNINLQNIINNPLSEDNILTEDIGKIYFRTRLSRPNRSR